MEKYVNDAIFASGEDDLRESYDKEWALKDQGLREGREQGIEIGQAKGREEGAIESAKRMIEKYPSMTLSEIAEVLSLTESQVKSLM